MQNGRDGHRLSPDDRVALRAAADVISRVNGTPVSTAIVHGTLGRRQ
jgi:hypothetical protein